MLPTCSGPSLSEGVRCGGLLSEGVRVGGGGGFLSGMLVSEGVRFGGGGGGPFRGVPGISYKYNCKCRLKILYFSISAGYPYSEKVMKLN